MKNIITSLLILISTSSHADPLGGNRSAWDDMYVYIEGTTVVFCNALIYMGNQTVFETRIRDGDMYADILIETKNHIEPDRITVFPQEGYIAIPQTVLVEEYECAEIRIYPEGLS